MKKVNKSFFAGEFELLVQRRQKNTCLLFSGQGTAKPYMYQRSFESSEIMQDFFKIADGFSNQTQLGRISDYICNPVSVKKKELPYIENLALFTLQVSLFYEFTKASQIQYISSHSFGEFAGLVCAGIVAFDDMLKIVYQRDVFSVPGCMFAIRETEEKVRPLLSPDIYLSHKNTANQMVIATDPKNKDHVIKKFKKENIELFELKVNKPYHTQLMASTKEKMRNFLSKLCPEYKIPIFPFVSSVLKCEVNSENFLQFDFNELISSQVVEQGNFYQQMQIFKERQTRHFVEISPKEILTKFLRETLGDVHVISSNEFFLEIEKENKDRGNNAGISQKSRELVNKVFSRLTGYKIENISLNDRFEEELGIDSLKKAQLVFELLNESKLQKTVDVSRFKKISDFFDLVSYEEDFFENDFHVFCEDFKESFIPGPVSEDQFFIHKLEAIEFFGGKSSLANIDFKEKSVCRKLFIIEERLSIENCQLSVGAFYDFFQACTQYNWDVIIVTSYEKSKLFGWVGFLASLKKELSSFFFKIILTDSLAQECILRELNDSFCGILKYQNGKRYLPFYKKLEETSIANLKGRVLIIGGSGGIGQVLTDYIQKSAELVHVVGRRSLSEVSCGLSTKLRYTQLDSCSLEQLGEFFKQNSFDVVFVNSGHIADDLFINKTKDKFIDEFNKHILPFQNVVALSDKFQFQKIIFSSSVAGLFGNRGQTNYSLVKGMLNEFQSENINVIIWPPWDKVGMVSEEISQYLRGSGKSLLKPERALEMFSFSLTTKSFRHLYLAQEDFTSYHFPLANELEKKGNQLVKRYLISESFNLQGHCINGKIVFPGALGVFFFLKHLVFYNELSLDQIRFDRFIDAFELTSIDVISEQKKDFTQLTLGEQMNFVAVAKPRGSGKVDFEKMCIAGNFKYSFCSSEIYNVLFHRGKYQTLDQIQIFENFICAKTRYFTPAEESFVFLIDACFQSLGYFGYHRYDRQFLPLAIEKLDIFDFNFFGNYEIRFIVSTMDSSQISAELVVFRGSQPVIHLQKLQLVKVNDV
jgi:malonyl CoA-acyl carrier protein transacylase/acyl carrier protein